MINCLLVIECSLGKEGAFSTDKKVEIKFRVPFESDVESTAIKIWQEETARLEKEGKVSDKKSILYKQIPFP
jgi:hypothetical protein